MKLQRIEPGPGQESVWDYPRPPRLEPCSKQIRVEAAGQVIVETCQAYRVLETSHPPVYYFPPGDVRMELLEKASHGSFCEWKGHAHYYTLAVGERLISEAAWSYPNPTATFEAIAGYLAFYCHKMDGCFVGDQRAEPQPGNFYGGWITPDIVGPFKGSPGTLHW